MTNSLSPEVAPPSRDSENIQTWLSWWEIGGIVVVWSLIAATTMFEQMAGSCSRCDPSIAGMATSLSSYHLVWMVMTVPIFLGCSWLHPKRTGWGKVIAGHLVLAFVVLVSVRYGSNVLATSVLPYTAPDYTFRGSTDLGHIVDHFDFLSGAASYLLLLVAGFGRDAYLRYQARRQQAQKLARETNELRAQLTSAELEALRMQINPHFLFNTLHMVSTMAGSNPAGVRTSLARLSDMLRYALSTSDRPQVELSEEIRSLESYLTIQKMRLGDRLDVTVDVDDDVRDALVPTLLLQPLAENAMKYAFHDRTDRGHLCVRAHRTGDVLRIDVQDDGPGLPDGGVSVASGDRLPSSVGDGAPLASEGDSTVQTSHGVGLSNLRQRIDGLYGDDGSLDFETPDGGGLRVVIRIPFYTGTTSDLRVTAVPS